MYQDYKDLLSAFEFHGVKYLVVGGLAVIYHAQPRFTKDLEVLIKADHENAKATHAALVKFGAPVTNIHPEDLLDPNVFFRFGREPRAVDILISIPGVDFDAAWSRRVEVMIDAATGQTANFISAEDLLNNKAAAGRPQDLADADAIQKAMESRRETPKESGTDQE